jgi:hypothetical protein
MWTLDIITAWPHDRFLFGWERIAPTKKENILTLRLYLFIFTLEYNEYYY